MDYAGNNACFPEAYNNLFACSRDTGKRFAVRRRAKLGNDQWLLQWILQYVLSFFLADL